MKRLIKIIFCIFYILAFGLFLACDNGVSDDQTDDNSIVNEIHDTRAIVCFGDSLTNGYGASQGQTYPDYLQAKLRVPVINAGVDGDTSTNGLSRINRDVLAIDPQIVIIIFGGNDLFRGLSLRQTENNLRSMIERIDDGTRKIYIANWIPITEIDSITSLIVNIQRNYNRVPALSMEQLNDYIHDFKEILISLSAYYNAELIENIFDMIYDNSALMSDPIHPNGRGYEVMADNIYAVMEPYIKANNLLK